MMKLFTFQPALDCGNIENSSSFQHSHNHYFTYNFDYDITGKIIVFEWKL